MWVSGLLFRSLSFVEFISTGWVSGTRKAFSRSVAILAVFLTMVCASAARADSIAVTYTATDLGGGTWEYEYSLTGALSSGDDLAIYFPLATSSNLNDLLTGGADFTTFVFQPDAGLPAPGEYDVIANIDNPDLTPVFDASFSYTGSGSPGSQDFTLYDANYNIIGSGSTTPAGTSVAATPEPASLVLIGLALVALYTLCSWRSGRYRPNEEF